MAFKFEFKRTAGTAADNEQVKAAIEEALRALGKKLKELGVSISLTATIDGMDH